MKSLVLAATIFLPISAAVACDKPFSVFQNGPNVILELTMKQSLGEKIPKEAADLVAQFNADRDRYWSLKVKSDPVCSIEVDSHDCIGQCKNRPAEIVKAATYNLKTGFFTPYHQMKGPNWKKKKPHSKKSGRNGSITSKFAYNSPLKSCGVPRGDDDVDRDKYDPAITWMLLYAACMDYIPSPA